LTRAEHEKAWSIYMQLQCAPAPNGEQGINLLTTVMRYMPALKKRATFSFIWSASCMHLRPAARLAQATQEYIASIELSNGGMVANAKSIIGILTLGIARGARITITAEGCDAVQAIHAMEELCACFVAERELGVSGGLDRFVAGLAHQR